MAFARRLSVVSAWVAAAIAIQSSFTFCQEVDSSAVVSFTTEPRGCSVWVNGRRLNGHTPLTAKVRPGAAVITVRAPGEGYKAVTASYNWDAGEVRRISIVLPKTFGWIRVDTGREWKQLKIDGKPSDLKPAAWQRIQAGSHVVLGFNGRYVGVSRLRVTENGRLSATLTWRKATPDPSLFAVIDAAQAHIGSIEYASLNPLKMVHVDAFWLQRNEVTVQQYRECVLSGSCSIPGSGEGCNWNLVPRQNHPINCVSATQANDYARWFSKQDEFAYRLPSNVEWEHAATARGTGEHPWGSGAILGRCNICDRSCTWRWHDTSVDDHWPETAPVGLFSECAGPDQIRDLIGNVAEWCSTSNPGHFDLRGGSWASPTKFCDPRLPNLKQATFQDATTGFRLAASSVDLSTLH